MHHYIRSLSIALWLISLATPTSTLQNGIVANGAQIVLAGLAEVVFMFPIGVMSKPLPALSLLSNIIFLGEIWRRFRKPDNTRPLCIAFLTISSALLNVSLGPHLKPLFPDILSHPGFYLWSSSFVLLASVEAYERRLFIVGLFKRSMALGAIAGIVFFIGLAVILLSR
jgi:hypothetical protein